MNKRFLFLLLAVFFAFSCVNAEITGATSSEEDSEESSSSSSNDESGGTISVNLELPPEDERTIEFEREQSIAGTTDTKFNWETRQDYIQIINHRKNNPSQEVVEEDSQYYGRNIEESAGFRYEEPENYLSAKQACQTSTSCSPELFNSFREYDNSFEYEELQSQTYERIKQLEQQQNSEEGLNREERQELENKKQFLQETMTGTDFMNHVLTGENAQDLAQAYNDCSGITCYFVDKIEAEDFARKSVLEAQDEVLNGRIIATGENCPDNQECMSGEEYNEQLEERINEKINFDEIEECEDLTSCNTEEIQCGEDADCLRTKQLIATTQEEKFNQEAISLEGASQATYSVLNSLINPDQQAIRASQFFGFERDYHDLPSIIRNDFPSQVCLAEIDGYLNDVKQTQTAGNQQGVTQYGCIKEDERGTEYEQNERRLADPCIDVEADIRAQRTPLTPDNSFQVTFSSYIKAPSGADITGQIFVKYSNEQGAQKEEMANFSLEQGDDSSLFDTQNIPINQSLSLEGFDDSQIVEVQLLAKDTSGDTYIDLTTPAYLITRGDVYEDPIREN